jgi:hypothetical protein
MLFQFEFPSANADTWNEPCQRQRQPEIMRQGVIGFYVT